MEDRTILAGKHKMTMESRKSCKVSGVCDTLSFDENRVVLETVDGMLDIKGSQLHVSRISLEKGEADVEGKVDSLVYTEKKSFAKKGESLMKRLFG